jgi:cytochrome c
VAVLAAAQTEQNAGAVRVVHPGGQSVEINLGQPLEPAALAAYDITVFPDGARLPPGMGTVEQGEALYQSRCAMCHGEEGIEGPASRLAGPDGFFSLSDPLRILRINKYPLLVLSVGGQWPYATSIFDYVRRAMPHMAPKSLSNDEVYAVTAYVLYLNDLLEMNARLDRDTLPKITMPGQERTQCAWTPC